MLRLFCAGVVLLAALVTAQVQVELLSNPHGQHFNLKKTDGTVVLRGRVGSPSVQITQDGPCTDFSSEATEVNEVLQDCIELGTSHWYGGPEQWRQNWPLDDVTLSDYSIISKGQDSAAVAEPYWLSSAGVYIHVQDEVPLFIDMNHEVSKSLCLIAKSVAPYPTGFKPTLKYKVCSLANAREAHMHALQNVLDKPSGYPDERMIRHPIWSTWARYKQNINEETVLKFADEILEHGFNNSQLEIDDKWEACYGSLTFRDDRFPNPKRLTDALKSKGYRVTLWMHPFINLDCKPWVDEATSNGYFVYNDTSNDIETSWWNGHGGIVDFTNPAAREWYVERVKTLQTEAGIDSFKFDAGETSSMPQPPRLNTTNYPSPGVYTHEYVKAVSQFGTAIEVRVAQKTQNIPVFVRMLDKDSRWDISNGLQAIVTSIFQMNMVGYTFILPDMIGGNGYGGAPTKELFIRWLQANVFMPTLQYSYVPWDYDDEAVEICKKYTDLHAQFADTIISLTAKAVQDGSPINPPIWWVDPTDETAQTISTEYLLGEDILVAPVMEEGATSRDIYLPKGQWQDELRSQVITGPTWLRDYSVSLSELAYFTRISS